MEEKQENYFETLNSINVSDKIEQIDNGKRKLNYLSWAWAWGELKKLHPDATSTVYETANGMNYHTDGKTAWVKVGVTVNGIEHIEYLPVMNRAHKSLPLNEITSWDVNVAIQRATTKAIGRHGLGLYIYAGEDLPESEQADTSAKGKEGKTAKAEQKKSSPIPEGYPKRDEMIKACSDYYKGDNLKKLLDYYHASEIKYLKNEQLVTAYSKTVKTS